MMRYLALSVLALSLSAISAQASFTITFDAGDPIGGVTAGSTLSNQYAGVGVIFSPNGFSGAGGPTGTWGTNTDMTIVSSTGGDVGGLGTPSLVSGNLLRSFNGWLAEDGDASFKMTFSTPMTLVSLDMAGIATPTSSRMFLFDLSNNLIGTVIAGGMGQQTLSFSSGTPIGSAIVTPGDFFDWVGVDNITLDYAPVAPPDAVPVPPTVLAAGFGWVALLVGRRFRR